MMNRIWTITTNEDHYDDEPDGYGESDYYDGEPEYYDDYN